MYTLIGLRDGGAMGESLSIDAFSIAEHSRQRSVVNRDIKLNTFVLSAPEANLAFSSLPH